MVGQKTHLLSAVAWRAGQKPWGCSGLGPACELRVGNAGLLSAGHQGPPGAGPLVCAAAVAEMAAAEVRRGL